MKNNNYAVVDYAEPVLNYYLNAGGQMGTRFEQLVLQNMKLLREYEDNKFFMKAYQRVQISYLSFLSENSKKKAFFYLFRNLNLIVVPGFQRVIVKMFLPIPHDQKLTPKENHGIQQEEYFQLGLSPLFLAEFW